MIVDARFVTRRARACGYLASATDYHDKGYAPDKLGRVTIVCTLVDIGDPRFRIWLRAIADRRVLRASSFTVELFDPHVQADESTTQASPSEGASEA